MKYSDLHEDPERHKDIVGHIDKRWRQLHELDIKHGDAAVNFLMIVSGGSAAATLAFIGNAMKEGSAPGGAILMLGFFAFSIFFVGLMKARLVYHVRGIFINWRLMVKQFFSDEIEWNDVLAKDEEAVAKNANMVLYLGWAAFACWCAGVVIGFIKLQEDSRHGRQEIAISTQAAATVTDTASPTASGEGLQRRNVRAGTEVEQHRYGTSSATTTASAEERKVDDPARAAASSFTPPTHAPAPLSASPAE